jgi:hypothetical protein
MTTVVVLPAVGLVKNDVTWVPFAKRLTMPPNERGARGFATVSVTVALTVTPPELSTAPGESDRVVVVADSGISSKVEFENTREFCDE